MTVFGYGFYTLFSASKTGDKNRLDNILTKFLGREVSVSLRLRVGSYTIHFHHWLYLSLIGSCSYYFDYQSNVIPFFCIGGAMQGIINYHDWYLVVTKRDSEK